jgi:uncharacterized protein YbcI
MLCRFLPAFRACRIHEGGEDKGAGMASTHTEPALGGSKAAAISNHVVQTMSVYTGRGPTKSRTYLNDDIVTVVLQCTLTKGERSLVSDNLDELVLTMRKAFQGTMRHDLINGIEAILERKVIAFMSDNHIDPDVAVEVFCLRRSIPAHRATARAARFQWRSGRRAAGRVGPLAPLPSPLATVAVNLDGLRAVLRGDLDLARLGVLGGQRPNPLRSTATPTRAFLPLARPPMRPG